MATQAPLPHRGLGSSDTSVTRYRSRRRGDLAIWWQEIDRGLLILVLTTLLNQFLSKNALQKSAIASQSAERASAANAASRTSGPTSSRGRMPEW
jgi:hypothetical protein